MTNTGAKVFEIRDPLSYVSLRIRMYFNTEELAVGTAFVYLYNEKPYLVTNWHNVSGREPSTLIAKHSQLALPNQFCVEIPFVSLNQENFSISWEPHPVLIYRDHGDSPTEAIWYEHPEHGYKVDVIAIPVDEDGVFSPLKSIWYEQTNTQSKSEHTVSSRTTAICAVNDSSLNLKKVRLRPSLDVFILGFPTGMSGGGNFPVWKRGSIASEPDLDIDGLPKMFIDTATRKGMSGAPVYVQQTGRWLSEEKDNLGNFQQVLGEGRRFIGVYSGRVGDDNFQAQLGIVWKPSTIEEVIQSSTIGKSSFDLSPLP